MNKTILLTGATDGIGFEAAKMFAELGKDLLLHGRSKTKVEAIVNACKAINSSISVKGFVADFGDLKDVQEMVEEIKASVTKVDVLVNNAGVFKANATSTVDDLELRFAVNTYAPYIITKGLLGLMDVDGRIVNLSSAAQTTVDLGALEKSSPMSHNDAYAQSKLAMTMWSIEMAQELAKSKGGPGIIALNPKSFLGSKMVKEGYGMEGHDVRIGGDVIVQLALSDAHSNSSGKYYDNDQGAYGNPHPDALDPNKRRKLIEVMEDVLSEKGLSDHL